MMYSPDPEHTVYHSFVLLHGAGSFYSLSVKDTMEVNHIRWLQSGYSYGEDSTHIFTIGQMDCQFSGGR